MRLTRWLAASAFVLLAPVSSALAQGVTTGSLNGIVTDTLGASLADVTITAVHLPSGTTYRGVTRNGGAWAIPNVRVGGPYTITAHRIGYRPGHVDNITAILGQSVRIDLALTPTPVEVQGISVAAAQNPVLNADRTGAATYVSPEEVQVLPSISRSTRDLTRLDPRSDGNMSFGGRNWLYNNISVDGSYFGNAFGLDDPAPGGQAHAEPLPYDAVEQVEVSLSPFNVTQGGFTGASINIVTRSGTNRFRGTAYGFGQNESFIGNNVAGSKVSANPNLSHTQFGVSLGGPIMRDRMFFYVTGEMQRQADPGSDFVASANGTSSFGVSRVRTSTMDSIRQRMQSVYNYDTGPYEGYQFHTDNDKFLAKLDWNLSAASNLSLRYNYLNAKRDQGPHPFVLSFANSGRGPNSSSLPFYNSGYAIHNRMHSIEGEWNVRGGRMANRLFASYTVLRDHRTPFSEAFPTIEIGENGVTYTTVGEEPFSIHNILNSNILQLTDNVTMYRGRHAFTAGGTFESFSFFNSFNIFRNGVFFLPYGLFPGTSTFSSVQSFFQATDPNNPNKANFRSFNGSGLYKGEDIHFGQVGIYLQDELVASNRLNLTYGLRADFPIYFTKPVDNPFSRGLTALDENRQSETVDQSKLPSSAPLWSPRIGFNYNAAGDRTTQIRGGTGVFTGRIPFVWLGNVYSNPGANPNLYPNAGAPVRPTGGTADSSTLAQSFDVNAIDPKFKFPQVWTTDFAIDRQLPWHLLGTFEVIYGKDLHGVFMRNADLRAPVGTVQGDGRPFYGACAFAPANCPTNATSPELNQDGGAGIYVLDNMNRGHSLNVTIQLQRSFGANLHTSLSYNFLDARNALKSTEIASVLWQNQPVAGDPNQPGISYSEFGQRHRIVGSATFAHAWSARMRTSLGMFLQIGQGNRFDNGGNRYSFIYSGDVNGDGQGGNDLIYIPRTQSEIQFDPCNTACGSNVSPTQQWAALDAFINQDKYLSAHRGQVAQRMGALNPWFWDVDLRVLHDIGLGPQVSRLQVSLDVLNFFNLLNSNWGVRKVADPSALSPLTLVRWTGTGAPVFNFTGPSKTYINDPNVLSRWRLQLGLRYIFE